MIDSQFISLVFEQSGQFALLLVVVAVILYLSLKKLKISVLHPFTYFCLMLNTTAYSVVILFTIYLDANLIITSYIAISSIIMISCLRMGYELSPKNVEKLFSSLITVREARLVQPTFIFIFMVLFCLYLLSGANTIATESRFEAASGMGIIIRLIEATAVIVMCFSTVRTDNKFFISSIPFGVSFFAISSTVVAGSKGGILEALLWYVFLSDKLGKKVSSYKVIFIAVIAVATAITVLWYNLLGMGIDVSQIKGSYSNFPFIIEKLLIRLIANGDMYYFTLVPDVEKYISVAYGPFQIPFQFFGSGFVNSMFGVDLPNNEPGRQAFLYWYPLAPMGGPTNHLDLAFYFYLGPYLGIVGVAITSLMIGWLHGVVTKASPYSYVTAFFMVFYCKILLAFASPSVAVQRMLDAGMLLISFLICLKIIYSVSKPVTKK